MLPTTNSTTAIRIADWPRSSRLLIAFADGIDGIEGIDGIDRFLAAVLGVLVALQHASDRDDLRLVVEVHDPHPGGAAALLGDVAHRHADRDTGVGDQEQLVLR